MRKRRKSLLGLAISIIILSLGYKKQEEISHLIYRIYYHIQIIKQEQTTKHEDTIANIEYSTGVENYPAVWLYEDREEDNIRYKNLKKAGKTCNEIDYGIGGGRGCSNITGYVHIYTIPQRGLQIKANQYALSDYSDHPGIFTTSITSPFILSGNKLYTIYTSGKLSDEYIQYHTLQTGETREDIIKKSPNFIRGNGIIYKKLKPQFYSDNTVGYQELYEESNNVTMILTYITNPKKSYYYTLFDTSLGCGPGPCDMNRHEITYFLN